MDKIKQEIIISWPTLWRIVLILILVVALFIVRDVLLILFLAIVVSAAFDRPVSYLESKGLPRILGTLFIFLLVLGFLAFILYTIIPLGLTEFKDFLDNVSQVRLPVFGSFDGSSLLQKIDLSLSNTTDALLSGGVSLFDFVARIFGNIILVITAVVISFYLTVSRGGVEKFLRTVLPLTYEDYAVGFYHRVRRKMGLWLQGQLILMFIVGALVYVGLWILGVKYSLILATLAGLLEIVPVGGPMLAGTVSFLVAASESLLVGFYAALLFFIIHQLESNLLVPLVMRKTVDISPVVVVVALLAGYELAGVIGVVLAVPTAVIFEELLEDWEEKKVRARSHRLEI